MNTEFIGKKSLRAPHQLKPTQKKRELNNSSLHQVKRDMNPPAGAAVYANSSQTQIPVFTQQDQALLQQILAGTPTHDATQASVPNSLLVAGQNLNTEQTFGTSLANVFLSPAPSIQSPETSHGEGGEFADFLLISPGGFDNDPAINGSSN